MKEITNIIMRLEQILPTSSQQWDKNYKAEIYDTLKSALKELIDTNYALSDVSEWQEGKYKVDERKYYYLCLGIIDLSLWISQNQARVQINLFGAFWRVIEGNKAEVLTELVNMFDLLNRDALQFYKSVEHLKRIIADE